MGLLWGGLVLAASVRLSTIAFQPILAGYRSGREIQDLAAEYREARLRNERLHRQIAYLKTSDGIEEEARRLGWVRTGERPLQIVLPEKPSMSGSLAAAEFGSPPTHGPGHPQRTTAPSPRSTTAERIQQMLATWSATRWLGALLQRKS
jgi:cell division protein FtsB